jgi:hypothetical protein
MYIRRILLAGVFLSWAFRAAAADRFPVFIETSFMVGVPMTMTGYQRDPAFEADGKAVYTLIGQIFTNAAGRPLQTTAQGFSGTTDRGTPWKTLTELLAVYQAGSGEKQIRSLYAPAAQSFMDKVYGDPAMTARLKSYTGTITDMQAVMVFEEEGGFMAVMNVSRTTEKNSLMPFFLIETNGAYLLSTHRSTSKEERNVCVFLTKHPAAELVQ